MDLGGIADKTGLKPGDVVVEINGRAADEKMLSNIDTRLAAGRSVMIIYEREGKKDMATLRWYRVQNRIRQETKKLKQ